MMRVNGGNTLIHTVFGRFVISASGEIRRQQYNEPISDKYGNVLDNENRTMTNAAGDIEDFRSDASEGMILNNGSVAFNGDFGLSQQVQVMEFKNFKVLGYVEGYLKTDTCLFQYMNVTMRPLNFDMTYFTTKIVSDMIILHTISEYDIIAFSAKNAKSGQIQKFMITAGKGADSGATFELADFSGTIHMYIYENFLLIYHPINIIDDPAASHKLERVDDYNDVNVNVYVIKNKGRLTKAAARELAIHE